MNNGKRYLIIMAIGVAMNIVLHNLASHLGWPIWLDMTGTAVAAFLLEPAAGLIVGLVNNFCLAVFDYNASSLLYYAVSAAVALIVGLNMRRKGIKFSRRVVSTIVLVIVVSSILSTLLTLWRTGGIPDAAGEIYYYHIALAWEWPNALACFFGIFVIKIYDILVSAAIVAAVCHILPKALKTSLPARLQE